MRCERQIDVDKLCLLMQAIQREVIAQLHGQDSVFLLKEEELSEIHCQEEGAKEVHLQQEKTAFLTTLAIQTHTKNLKRQFLDSFDMTTTALSIMQTVAFHSSCKRCVAKEPVISVKENKCVFLVAQQVAQITQSTGYPFGLMVLCKYD